MTPLADMDIKNRTRRRRRPAPPPPRRRAGEAGFDRLRKAGASTWRQWRVCGTGQAVVRPGPTATSTQQPHWRLLLHSPRREPPARARAATRGGRRHHRREPLQRRRPRRLRPLQAIAIPFSAGTARSPLTPAPLAASPLSRSSGCSSARPWRACRPSTLTVMRAVRLCVFDLP